MNTKRKALGKNVSTTLQSKPPKQRALINYLKQIHEKGGPAKKEFSEINDVLTHYFENLSREEIKKIQPKIPPIFGDIFINSCAGHATLKPYGYAGDFEIIDLIYHNYHSKLASLKKWDQFFHWHPATKAVRNRKTYFKGLLKEQLKSRKKNQPFSVLNIASGPCRDVLEFYEEEKPKDLFFDCVEADLDAILHATRINYQHLPKITFHKKNIFRFKTDKQFDLVWSAGLFDYFNDKMFTKLISNIAPYVKPGGEMVIGNFADTNPTLGYMELFLGWYLHHRSESDLKELATKACGKNIKSLKVEQEPEGVNLFIRIRL